MSFAPIPVRRPREQVELQLRSAILDGTFANGSKLPSEGELATRFQVSRTTIREALRTLASDNLVYKTPGAHGGTFVRVMDFNSLSIRIRDSVDTVIRLGSASVAEMIEVRHFLELPACELAAVHRNDAQLAQLRKCLDDADAVSLDDPRFEQLHVRFHTLIGEASTNRLVSSFVSALHGIPFDQDTDRLPTDYTEQTRDQHEAIYTALENKDPAGVRAAMDFHLLYLRGIFLDDLSDTCPAYT